MQLDLGITLEEDELVISATASSLHLDDPESEDGFYFLLDRDGPLWRCVPGAAYADTGVIWPIGCERVPGSVAAVVVAWRAAVPSACSGGLD